MMILENMFQHLRVSGRCSFLGEKLHVFQYVWSFRSLRSALTVGLLTMLRKREKGKEKKEMKGGKWKRKRKKREQKGRFFLIPVKYQTIKKKILISSESILTSWGLLRGSNSTIIKGGLSNDFCWFNNGEIYPDFHGIRTKSTMNSCVNTFLTEKD